MGHVCVRNDRQINPVTAFLAVCARLDDNELVSAECEALTGSKPARDGITTCREIEAIWRGAYVLRGVHLLASAGTLDALVNEISSLAIPADDFRIEVAQLKQGERISERQTILALADVLHGNPNLDAPRHRFVALNREDGLYFGEVVVESDHSYKRHASKPYHMSSSLSSQMARALVNLAAPSTATLLDPCCGTGSILLEAKLLGLTAYGCDINPRMVGMSRKNLAYFGYTAQVQLLEARDCQQQADAVVTDLPYGRFQIMEESNIRGILEQCTHLAPESIFVAGENLTHWMEDSGYEQIEVYQVMKFNDFKRFVHKAHSQIYK